MKEGIKRSIAVIILLALAVAAGIGADRLFSAIQSKNYPRAYSEYVQKYAEQYGVPESVIYATIKSESNFRYDAESYKSARGLMQLMPGTFEWLCEKEDIDVSTVSIDDPEMNIRMGTKYLAYLYGEFEIWETVYAAYNAGHGVVRSWLADEKYGKDGHLTDIPYSETASYVKKVSDARQIYEKLLEADKKAAQTEN
ncbi:MAG: lytic transglycosylase domain-containing protein [Clostridia bacterium]|nr:lytic transglycosylase domain-containing protein [Clostridia bacterium]